MDIITAYVKRHQLVAFFVLAYALTWPLIPLVRVSPLWGFPALFGPALAAVNRGRDHGWQGWPEGPAEPVGTLARRGALVRGRAWFAHGTGTYGCGPAFTARRTDICHFR